MSDSRRITLGELIRKRRLELKLTQEDVARPLVTDAYISQVEHGHRHPTRRVIDHLAGVLDLDLSDYTNPRREADKVDRAAWLVDELERTLGPSHPLNALRLIVRNQKLKVERDLREVK